jgi:hypothetical protein
MVAVDQSSLETSSRKVDDAVDDHDLNAAILPPSV